MTPVDFHTFAQAKSISHMNILDALNLYEEYKACVLHDSVTHDSENIKEAIEINRRDSLLAACYFLRNNAGVRTVNLSRVIIEIHS